MLLLLMMMMMTTTTTMTWYVGVKSSRTALARLAPSEFAMFNL